MSNPSATRRRNLPKTHDEMPLAKNQPNLFVKGALTAFVKERPVVEWYILHKRLYGRPYGKSRWYHFGESGTRSGAITTCRILDNVHKNAHGTSPKEVTLVFDTDD